VRKFIGQEIQRGSHVALFSVPFVMLTCTGACSAKVEAQNRKAERVKGFRGLVHDFVVHGAAEERMRMTYQRRHAGDFAARGLPENGLQASGGP